MTKTEVLPDATTSQLFAMDYRTQQTIAQSVAYCSPALLGGRIAVTPKPWHSY